MSSPKGLKTSPGTGKRWVVVQLSQNGEHETNLTSITKSVERLLKRKLETFIPATTQKVRSDQQTIFYMDGYIFVEYYDGVPYHRLNQTTYFESIVSFGRDRLNLVHDRDIAPLRKGVDSLKVGLFKIGDEVKVIKGTFKNLTGTVSAVYDGGEQIQLNVKLSSKPMLIDYPSSYVVKVVY